MVRLPHCSCVLPNQPVPAVVISELARGEGIDSDSASSSQGSLGLMQSTGRWTVLGG